MVLFIENKNFYPLNVKKVFFTFSPKYNIRTTVFIGTLQYCIIIF